MASLRQTPQPRVNRFLKFLVDGSAAFLHTICLPARHAEPDGELVLVVVHNVQLL